MKTKCPHCNTEQETNSTGSVAFCEHCYLAYGLRNEIIDSRNDNSPVNDRLAILS